MPFIKHSHWSVFTVQVTDFQFKWNAKNPGSFHTTFHSPSHTLKAYTASKSDLIKTHYSIKQQM